MLAKRAYESVRDEVKGTRHKLLKLFWIFLLASLVGALVEILFVGVTTGRWMSRSGLLYGQFSAIWGLGAVLMTVLLHRLSGKNDRYIFICGALLGGGYEYLCSWVGEKVFGVLFWDYSDFVFNLGGRINLLFCLFWGMAAVAWVKVLYPRMSRLVDRFIHWKHKTFVLVVTVLMVANIVVSLAALWRYGERQAGDAPDNAVERFLDEHYDDEFMEHRYQNMRLPEDSGS